MKQAVIDKKVDWTLLVEEMLNVKGSLSKIYNRFYNYSFGNQLLLFCQDVTEPVATYKKWGELGRQVKKGSKAKMIIRPVPVYSRDEDGEKDEKFVTFRPINSVFALSDTEGDELDEPKELPKWDSLLALQNLKIEQMPFDTTNGNVQGYAEYNKLAINPVAGYPLSTMAHEQAHIVLGHTDSRVADMQTLERDIKEFQAAAVAFIVMNESEATDGVDYDRKGIRGYIQSWLDGKMPTESDIKPIFSAADKILKAGLPEVPDAKATI